MYDAYNDGTMSNKIKNLKIHICVHMHTLDK